MLRYLHQRQWRTIVGLTLILSLGFVARAGASSTLRLARFSDVSPRDAGTGAIFAGMSYPEGATGYRSLGLSDAVQPPAGRTIAALTTLPAGTESVEAKFLDPRIEPPGTLGFTYLASIRYRVNGHLVYVVTSEPTAAAKERQIILGETPVDLGQGRTAYISREWERKQGDKAYRKEYVRLALAQDGLIVTVYSDLPEQELVEIARGVAMMR